MAKYDGWILKNKWGSLLLWTAGSTRREVTMKLRRRENWKKEGHKIVKIKLIEVN